MGPICEWDVPSCFIIGDRGIMIEQKIGSNCSVTKPLRKRFPSLLAKRE